MLTLRQNTAPCLGYKVYELQHLSPQIQFIRVFLKALRLSRHMVLASSFVLPGQLFWRHFLDMIFGPATFYSNCPAPFCPLFPSYVDFFVKRICVIKNLYSRCCGFLFDLWCIAPCGQVHAGGTRETAVMILQGHVDGDAAWWPIPRNAFLRLMPRLLLFQVQSFRSLVHVVFLRFMPRLLLFQFQSFRSLVHAAFLRFMPRHAAICFMPPQYAAICFMPPQHAAICFMPQQSSDRWTSLEGHVNAKRPPKMRSGQKKKLNNKCSILFVQTHDHLHKPIETKMHEQWNLANRNW